MILLFGLLVLLPAVIAEVKINEVMVNAPGRLPDLQWVELYSTTTENLEGWILTDGEDTFVLPRVKIVAGTYLLLAYDSSASLPRMRNVLEYGQAAPQLFLGSDQDELKLSDAQGRVQSDVVYGREGDDSSAPLKGNSIARVHDGVSEFIVSAEPTPGTANNRKPHSRDLRLSTEENVPLVIQENVFVFEDEDGDTLQGIIITRLPTEGRLMFNNVPVQQNQVISGRDFSVGKLVFTPDRNEFGISYATIQFRVSDRYAASSEQYTLILDVNSVSSAPTSENVALVINEDSFHRFGEDDFTYSDEDGDSFQGIVITDTPNRGVLRYREESGMIQDVNSGQQVSVTDVTDGKLIFIPFDNEFGEEYGTFEFAVFNANELSEERYTVTISVLSVNDAPTTGNKTITIQEDRQYVFTQVDFAYEDLELDAFDSITITRKEFAGALRFDESDIDNGDVIPVSEIQAGKLVYTPAPDEFKVPHYDSFAFTVSDGLDQSAPATVQIDVEADRDSPSLNIDDQTMEEDGQPTIIDLWAVSSDSDTVDEQLSFSIVEQTNTEVVSCRIEEHTLTCTPQPNRSGESRVTLEVRDDSTIAGLDILTITVREVNDVPSIVPIGTLQAAENVAVSYDIVVNDVDSMQSSLFIVASNSALPNWLSVDQINPLRLQGIPPRSATPFSVRVVVSDGQDISAPEEFEILVQSDPLTTRFETNVPTDATEQQLAAFPQFMLRNAFGRIVFTQPIDLRTVRTIDADVAITEGVIAVDSTDLPQLNAPARVTVFKQFTHPVIQRSIGFNSGMFERCPATVCRNAVQQGNEFSFDVAGFSTYRVVEDIPAGLSISEILFSNVIPGQSVNVTITVRNSGTLDSVQNLSAVLENVPAQYHAQLQGTLPASLAPGEQATLQLGLTVPLNERSGRHSLGSLVVRSAQATVTKTIELSTQSFLVVENVEVDGKESGELSLAEPTEVEITIQNEYTEDMEDVTLTVELLDVDDNDLEEEADSFDLNNGDDETVTVEFDLSHEDVDKNEYTLRITVEGEAEDGTEHETVFEKTVRVDREKHNVMITNADLVTPTVECQRQTKLRVDLKNIGTEDEDEVEVRVKNTPLRIEQKQEGLELDDYSSSRNDDTAEFTIDVENARAGKYDLTVEVYVNGKLKDTETVPITVKECLSTQTTTQRQPAQYSADGLVQEIQRGLQERGQLQQRVAPVQQENVVVSSSFRDSQVYLGLLITMMVLIFIAVVLALVTLTLSRKRRMRKR